MSILTSAQTVAHRIEKHVQRPTGTGIYWTLRVALAACFIGHGAFGIITKADWLPYFAVVGIPAWVGWQLEPLVGTADISLGLLTLFYPVRIALGWALFWTLWTALLRPLAGQGIWEFLERAGNYGVPLAMLYLSGWRGGLLAWCREKASPRALDRLTAQRAAWILRLSTALLLIGHGGFGLFLTKPAAWTKYFGVLGLDSGTVQSASLIPLVGGFEVALGLAVLVMPARGLLLFVLAWKVGTELLRLGAGEPVWEFVERGGSYGAPLALLLLNRWQQRAEARVDSDVAPRRAVIKSIRPKARAA
jgi:uncharacterized membrane protein YphA (DoxX/SURF4 family)